MNNEKYLLILGASRDQIPAYKRAKGLGIKTIGVDYNPFAPAFKYCDIPLIVSVKHEDQLIPALERIESEFEFIGVMTLGVEISPIVSMVAKRFGLIAVDETVAYLTTNKCGRSVRLAECGIPIPKFQSVKIIGNITIPLPFVVKPSDSSASRGVRRVDRIEDLEFAFEEAKSYSTDGRVLIEELLFGDEISIEGFMLNGKMHVTGFADRNYSTIPNSPEQPYFIENGSHSPTLLDYDIHKEACNVFEQGALALGITDGPSKGDLIVVDGKVIVIEITSRLSGGGFCSRIQMLQNGTDIVTATIQWHSGMDVDVDLLTPKFNKAVCHRFYFHDAGVVTNIEGIDTILEMPGIKHYVEQSKFETGVVLEPITYINRLFYVLSQADDITTAIKYADDAINSVKIDTENLPLTFV